MIIQLEEEFITMVKENKEDFYRLAYSYVKNEQEALDVVSESTYKALNSLNKIREKKYMKTWFYKILINESITAIRKKKNFVYDTQIIENITEDIEDKDQILDLYNSIDQLSEKYKTVIILKYLKQMQIKEIAEILQEEETEVETAMLELIMDYSVRDGALEIDDENDDLPNLPSGELYYRP